MVGVRDMLAGMARFSPVWETVHPDKAGMTDTFWNIPKSSVVPAIEFLFSKLQDERRPATMSFSLHGFGDTTPPPPN